MRLNHEHESLPSKGWVFGFFINLKFKKINCSDTFPPYYWICLNFFSLHNKNAQIKVYTSQSNDFCSL